MKFAILSLTMISARLIVSETDGLDVDTPLSRSARDLIGYNRMHNNAKIHRMKTFQNDSETRIANRSISDLIDNAKLSDEQSKRWNHLRQQMAAIRRLKRARMIKRFGY